MSYLSLHHYVVPFILVRLQYSIVQWPGRARKKLPAAMMLCKVKTLQILG